MISSNSIINYDGIITLSSPPRRLGTGGGGALRFSSRRLLASSCSCRVENSHDDIRPKNPSVSCDSFHRCRRLSSSSRSFRLCSAMLLCNFPPPNSSANASYCFNSEALTVTFTLLNAISKSLKLNARQ